MGDRRARADRTADNWGNKGLVRSGPSEEGESMQGSLARSRRRRVLASAMAIGSVVALTAGCTRGGLPWRRTTTTMSRPTTPTTDGHGHTDDDHAHLTTTTMDMSHGGGGGGGGGMDH